MYDDAPPASHAVTSAPAAAARSAAPLAPAPPAPDDMDALAGHDRPGRTGGARPAPISAAVRVMRARRPSPAGSDRSPRQGASRGPAPALEILFAPRSPVQTTRRTSVPGRARDRDVGQADGLGRRAAVGTGDPGDRDGQVDGRSAARAPSAIARATCALTAPWASRTACGHAELGDLHGVGVGDDPAGEVAGRAGDLGDRVGDEPAGARLGRRDRQAGGEDAGLEALGQRDEARPPGRSVTASSASSSIGLLVAGSAWAAPAR